VEGIWEEVPGVESRIKEIKRLMRLGITGLEIGVLLIFSWRHFSRLGDSIAGGKGCKGLCAEMMLPSVLSYVVLSEWSYRFRSIVYSWRSGALCCSSHALLCYSSLISVQASDAFFGCIGEVCSLLRCHVQRTTIDQPAQTK
jgi:hypothetical protein